MNGKEALHPCHPSPPAPNPRKKWGEAIHPNLEREGCGLDSSPWGAFLCAVLQLQVLDRESMEELEGIRLAWRKRGQGEGEA